MKTIANMSKTNSRLFSLPIIGGYVRRMVRNIEKYGMQGAILKEIERSKTNWEIHGLDKKTKKILKTRGVVIACNHPHEIETLTLIASLPKRKDFFLIANAGLMGISESLDKNIIPVFIRHHYGSGKTSFLTKMSGRLIEKYHPSLNLSPEEEHRKNITSVNEAANRVKKGGVVMIFPERHGKNRKWYPGIGWLLKNIGAKDNLYYVQAYISGSSNWDYLRLFPGLGRFLPKIKVYFAKPQKISEVYEADAKLSTLKLEKEYNQWQATL